jgi:N-acetylneuraminic acid mutarotase
MPSKRWIHSNSVVDGKIYVIGGGESPKNNTYSGVKCYTTLEEYDPATDTWTQKANMPTSRNDLSCCVLVEVYYEIKLIVHFCAFVGFRYQVSVFHQSRF